MCKHKSGEHGITWVPILEKEWLVKYCDKCYEGIIKRAFGEVVE